MSDEAITAPETPETPAAEVDAAAKVKAAGGSAETTEERKFKLKYGNSEREMTERELIAAAQKGWAADDRFQSAAKMKKDLEDAVKKGDLNKLIKQMKGKDPIEFYKDQLKDELRRRSMSPEERQLMEQQSKLDKLKAEEKEILGKREAEKLQKLEQHYIQQYDRELSEAIEKNGLPKNRVAIKRAADLASKVIKMGLDPDWDLVVKEAKRQMTDEWKELVGAYRDEDLLTLFGDDLPKRIGKAQAARSQIAGRAQQARVQGDGSKTTGAEKSAKPVDMSTWMKEQRKKFEGE